MSQTRENEEKGVRGAAEASHPSRDITPVDLEIYDEDIRNPRKRLRDISLPIFCQINNPRIRPRNERYTFQMRGSDDGANDEESRSTESEESEGLRGEWVERMQGKEQGESKYGGLAALMLTVTALGVFARLLAELVAK
jgi:hypothetical protein